jgi:ABC-2 type transport system ATP-binding protein
MPKFIEFKNIGKSFKNNSVINNCSFILKKGDVCGLIGPSGSGKTTLLRILAGFYKPSSGKILINGQDVTQNLDKKKEYVGFAVQDCSLYNELNVNQNLEYFGSLYNMKLHKIKQRANELLKAFNLSDFSNVLVHNLSGGMKKRVDIACSLIHDPELLILDEPMSGFDPLLRKHLWKLIYKINSMDVTIIISSHLLNEIEHLCDRIIVIKNGKTIAQGTTREIKDLYSINEEIHLETYPGNYEKIIENLSDDKGITNKRFIDNKIVIFTKTPEKTLLFLLKCINELGERLLDVDVNRPSLNEVFEYLEKEEND